MTTKHQLITADELLRLPRNGKRYELVQGMLSEKVAPGDQHAITVFLTASAISNYVDATGYGEGRTGEPGYRLGSNPDTVRAPDVAWIAPGRVAEGTRGYPELAPDLAVEVKSPGNSYAELADKAAMWLGHGSKEVWVADPERLDLTVYRPGAAPLVLGEDEDIDGSDLLPGFTSPVWRFFRRRR